MEMSLMDDISELSPAKEFEETPLYDTEVANGIYNLVVTLCNIKAQTMPLPSAKEEVAEMLEALASGLRATITVQPTAEEE